MKYELLDLSKEKNLISKLNISPFAIGISFIGQGDTYLTFQITGATPVPYNRTVYWTLGYQNITTYIYANNTTSGQAHFTGLSSGTSYTVYCSVSGDYPWSSSRTVQTTGTPKPNLWSWTSSEISAFNNKGSTRILTMERWNSFVSNVRGFYEWKYGGIYSDFDNAKIYDGILTAVKFNKIRNAIDKMCRDSGSNVVGVPIVSKGDIVYGWYFINLSNSMQYISK